MRLLFEDGFYPRAAFNSFFWSHCILKPLHFEAIALHYETIALHFEATTLQFEAIALYIEATALQFETIALHFGATTLKQLHCILKPLHCILKPLHCILKPLHCSLKPLHCSLKPLHCISKALYSVLKLLYYTLKPLHCNLKLLYCIFEWPLNKLHDVWSSRKYSQASLWYFVQLLFEGRYSFLRAVSIRENSISELGEFHGSTEHITIFHSSGYLRFDNRLGTSAWGISRF